MSVLNVDQLFPFLLQVILVKDASYEGINEVDMIRRVLQQMNSVFEKAKHGNLFTSKLYIHMRKFIQIRSLIWNLTVVQVLYGGGGFEVLNYRITVDFFRKLP